jgi:hypothetical protein
LSESIAITEAAFQAIARTLPLGSVGVEPKANEQDDTVASKLAF